MIFAELLMGLASSAALVVVMIVVLFELVVTVIFFLLELFLGLAIHVAVGGEAQKPQGTSVLTTLAQNKWVKRAGVAACGCLLLTLITGLILNLFFFEGTVRWILRQGESRSGTQIQFKSATGNLFTGRIELQDVTLKRDRHPTTTFELRAATLNVDLGLLSMVFGPRTIESAEIVGLRGEANRIGSSTMSAWFSGKRFLIKRLTLRDAQVTWADHTHKRVMPFAVQVNELTSQNLRSRWLALDLLFKSEGAGTINGGEFAVSRKAQGDGQETLWSFKGLPVAATSTYIGGPFVLLDAGTVEIQARTVWGESPQRPLDMNWAFVFRDVHAALPDTDGWKATLSRPAVAFINQHSRELPVSFNFKYEQGRFDGATSLEAAGLWQAVADGATEAIAAKLDVTRDQVEQVRDRAIGRIRSLLPTSQRANEAP